MEFKIFQNIVVTFDVSLSLFRRPASGSVNLIASIIIKQRTLT
jgi:hypothetical protein